MTYGVQENISLAPLTTFKTGGQAKYFFQVSTNDELKTAVAFSKEHHVPFFVLGGGSNVLVPDSGYHGVVILMGITGSEYVSVSETETEVTVGAGVPFDLFVAETVQRGLWGLENLSSIPGTVGATPVQNVGAYGVEVADTITEVAAYNTTSEKFETLTAPECAFGYRDSLFKHEAGKNYIITSVTFRLSRVPQPKLAYADLRVLEGEETPSISAIREEVIRIRSNKFPDWTVVGTAGSFFKNPIVAPESIAALLLHYPTLPMYPQDNGQVKVTLGFILDKVCGLKGYTNGNVGLYEKQALVVIAHHGATTTEINSFADEIADLVFKKTAIHIEREVTLLT